MGNDSGSSVNYNTLSLHAGQVPDPATGARAVPIYQSTSFVFPTVQDAVDRFSLNAFGPIYSRIGNPTNDVLEGRLAALEGGTGALSVASGTSAVVLAILNIARAGQSIVASSFLYGGTYNLFHYTLPKFGIDVRFVDSSNPANFEAAIDKDTRLLYTESIGNPKNNVDDFEAIGAIAHKHGIPFVVDNTTTPPPMFRPLEHGADIVVYSLTKFMGGHGTTIAGAIIEGGKFNWANGKFPEISEPDPSYHGMNFWAAFGDHDQAAVRGVSYIIKARVQLLRDLGPCLSPQSAFNILQGIETLPLRLEKHVQNAMAVAKWLETHPAVNWVNYPGLASHPDHARAKKYMPNGQGAIIGFGIKGGREAGVKLINSVKLFSHLANIGDAKSLIIHPASTTHQQLTPEEQLSTGVTDDFVRLSIGIENVEDIIADLAQALAAATA